jgi:hypothetical protein
MRRLRDDERARIDITQRSTELKKITGKDCAYEGIKKTQECNLRQRKAAS